MQTLFFKHFSEFILNEKKNHYMILVAGKPLLALELTERWMLIEIFVTHH